MVPPTKCAGSRQKKGLSLIEAAIVLGVVGLVIGGIWIAAAAVNENIKWRRTEDGWLYYINYVSHTYTAKLMATRNDQIAQSMRVLVLVALKAAALIVSLQPHSVLQTSRSPPPAPRLAVSLHNPAGRDS